jgi:hypothetical protein
VAVSESQSVTLTQQAVYPEILSGLVSHLKYKDGWVFYLQHLDRGQGSKGLTFVIQITVPDSYHPEQKITVLHYMIVPPAAYDKQSWTRWLLDQVLLVEQHEACEFFQFDGYRPYAPHHGPGHNPYTIFDQGTTKDAQTTFRGEHFELPKAGDP